MGVIPSFWITRSDAVFGGSVPATMRSRPASSNANRRPTHCRLGSEPPAPPCRQERVEKLDPFR